MAVLSGGRMASSFLRFGKARRVALDGPLCYNTLSEQGAKGFSGMGCIPGCVVRAAGNLSAPRKTPKDHTGVENRRFASLSREGSLMG